MKAIGLTIILAYMILTAPVNKPADKLDLAKFGGKWYSLASIPTMYDKGSRETTTNYSLTKDGYYSVVTTCKKGEKDEIKTYKSKLFTADNTDGEMQAQFLWPFKVDYWVIELADDYSYTVVGHPDHKFLFIMSRKPNMDKKLYEEIVARCKARGYEVDKIVSQHHNS
jgi:apolipoprotein D and lipocalin family protein